MSEPIVKIKAEVSVPEKGDGPVVSGQKFKGDSALIAVLDGEVICSGVLGKADGSNLLELLAAVVESTFSAIEQSYGSEMADIALKAVLTDISDKRNGERNDDGE